MVGYLPECWKENKEEGEEGGGGVRRPRRHKHDCKTKRGHKQGAKKDKFRGRGRGKTFFTAGHKLP